MVAAGQFRSRLSEAIASLASSATSEEASEALGPIVDGFAPGAPAEDEGDAASSDDGVTPLMVACDKANPAALEFLGVAFRADASLTALTGAPLDRAAARAGGNTAGHHAASSGFAGGIDFLASQLLPEPERAPSEGRGLLRVISQTNANGDTPVMMAAVSGRESLLSCWIDRLNGSGDVSSSEVRTLFEVRNDSGDSACSLASEHGFDPIVALLINPPSDGEEGTIEASHDDLEKCRSALARTESLMPTVRKKGNKQDEKYFNDLTEDIRRCVEILEPACERLARKKMNELLGGETEDSPTGEVRTKKGGRKRNAKKKRRGKKGTADASSADVVDDRDARGRPETPSSPQARGRANGVWTVDRDRSRNRSGDSPRVVTLQDGTVISADKATSYAATEEDGASRSGGKPPEGELREIPAVPPKSMDNLLRERGASVADGRGARGEQVGAIMDSLCLDPSMLLLTSHGMALDLSPCQLDAVEGILNAQLGSVREAKGIQARIREGD